MAGDVVLRNVGALLLAAGRAQDVVARVGGEEFGILLADATLDGAHLFASRLCDMIREHPFLIAGDATPVTVTTSIGVVAGSPRGEDTIATLLWSRADAALYAAKREGRDRACVWTSGLSGTDDYVIPSPHVQRDAIRRCSQELAAFQPTSAEASAP
jgi:two-component system cell cycle response regulator